MGAKAAATRHVKRRYPAPYWQFCGLGGLTRAAERSNLASDRADKGKAPGLR